MWLISTRRWVGLCIARVACRVLHLSFLFLGGMLSFLPRLLRLIGSPLHSDDDEDDDYGDGDDFWFAKDATWRWSGWISCAILYSQLAQMGASRIIIANITLSSSAFSTSWPYSLKFNQVDICICGNMTLHCSRRPNIWMCTDPTQS